METQTQRTFALPEGLVSALLNYLAQKPHAEVNQLVTALSQTIQAQLTPDEIAAITARQNGGAPVQAVAPSETTKTKKAAKTESKN